MAIARGAGTEIIRCHHFEGLNDTARTLIYGVQHHIYTVLSVIVFGSSMQAAGNEVIMLVKGYDSLEGTTNENNHIFVQPMNTSQTFVWNDKFSFNGYEPVDFAGPMDDATKQDAIADQGSSVSQYLQIETDSDSTTYDCMITFIDQNNS